MTVTALYSQTVVGEKTLVVDLYLIFVDLKDAISRTPKLLKKVTELRC